MHRYEMLNHSRRAPSRDPSAETPSGLVCNQAASHDMIDAQEDPRCKGDSTDHAESVSSNASSFLSFSPLPLFRFTPKGMNGLTEGGSGSAGDRNVPPRHRTVISSVKRTQTPASTIGESFASRSAGSDHHWACGSSEKFGCGRIGKQYLDTLHRPHDGFQSPFNDVVSESTRDLQRPDLNDLESEFLNLPDDESGTSGYGYEQQAESVCNKAGNDFDKAISGLRTDNTDNNVKSVALVGLEDNDMKGHIPQREEIVDPEPGPYLEHLDPVSRPLCTHPYSTQGLHSLEKSGRHPWPVNDLLDTQRNLHKEPRLDARIPVWHRLGGEIAIFPRIPQQAQPPNVDIEELESIPLLEFQRGIGLEHSRHLNDSNHHDEHVFEESLGTWERKRSAEEENQLLLLLREQGVTFEDIKRIGGFNVAASTLRGRYRALTKHPDDRPRNPKLKWTDQDVSNSRWARCI